MKFRNWNWNRNLLLEIPLFENFESDRDSGLTLFTRFHRDWGLLTLSTRFFHFYFFDLFSLFSHVSLSFLPSPLYFFLCFFFISFYSLFSTSPSLLSTTYAASSFLLSLLTSYLPHSTPLSSLTSFCLGRWMVVIHSYAQLGYSLIEKR